MIALCWVGASSITNIAKCQTTAEHVCQNRPIATLRPQASGTNLPDWLCRKERASGLSPPQPRPSQSSSSASTSSSIAKRARHREEQQLHRSRQEELAEQPDDEEEMEEGEFEITIDSPPWRRDVLANRLIPGSKESDAPRRKL